MKHRDKTAAQQKELIETLEKCDSLGAMLTVLQTEYNLNGVKLGITKKIYIGQLNTLLISLNPETKNV